MRHCARHFALLLLVAFCALFAPASFAVTDQTPTDISVAGVVDATSAADATGNTWTNTGYEYAEVINAAGAPITVTIDVYPSGGQGAPGGLTVTDPTVSVTNGTRKRIGPFPRAFYNDANNKVKLTFSSPTSVTVGVYRLTPAP